MNDKDQQDLMNEFTGTPGKNDFEELLGVPLPPLGIYRKFIKIGNYKFNLSINECTSNEEIISIAPKIE